MQLTFLFPLLWLAYGIEVRGRHNLRELSGPCLVISNHNMHLDWGMVLRTLPRRFRARTSIAAATDDIFGTRRRALTSALLGNAFPFDKDGSGVRESLEYVRGVLHDGWNVLLFPEGKLTVCGPTQPFKGGAGWIAVRSGAAVLPVRIDVVRPGIYEGRWFPNPRGRVRVSIGAPLYLPPKASYGEAVLALEEAVRTA